ncbi:MAG: prolipoprotein diacylglyceryl transferase [Oscillospiraceae bacterium]
MIEPFELFGKTISPYMLISLVGIFVAGVYALKMTKRLGRDDNDTLFLLLFSAIGVVFGGHLLFGLTNYKLIGALFADLSVITSFKVFADYTISIFGGSVFYGGLLGGLAVGYFYLKKKNYDIPFFTDIAAPTIPLFHIFGRIGCFVGGCCYGVPSSLGFTYHHSLVEAANGVSRFPVQLLEAGFNLALFLVLHKLLFSKKLKGRLLYIYLLSYSAARFLLEFLRGDAYRGFLLGLSTSQIISIGVFVATAILLIKKTKSPHAEA